MKLLIASKSPTRRRILEAAGVPFEGIEAPFDEEAKKAELAGRSAIEVALALAQGKALAACAADALVLGADQTLELDDGSLLSKPGSREELRDQLRRMSRTTHRLHSAAAVSRAGVPVWRHCESAALTMRRLSEGFINDYIAAEFDQVRWNVGGYRIEGPGAQLFERIEGSHFAILGLPLLPLLVYLREQGLLAS